LYPAQGRVNAISSQHGNRTGPQVGAPGAMAEDVQARIIASIEAYVAQQKGVPLPPSHGGPPPSPWFCQPLAMSAQAGKLLNSTSCVQLASLLRQHLAQAGQGPAAGAGHIPATHQNGRPQSPVKPQHHGSAGSLDPQANLGYVLSSLAASMAACHTAGFAPLHPVLDSFRATGSSCPSSTPASSQGSMWPSCQPSLLNDLSVSVTPVLLSVDASAGQPACSSGGGLELAVLLEFSPQPQPLTAASTEPNLSNSGQHLQLIARAPHIPGPLRSDNSSLSGANVRLFGELGQGGGAGAVAPASVPRLLRGITVLDEVGRWLGGELAANR
jgi:hypothetical protein